LEDLGFDRATILQRLRYLPLDPFRSTYAYTNFGITAAAESVAVGRDTTWSALSAELVYRPLGMTSTSSDFSDYASRSNRAIGHVRDGERWVAREIRQPDAQSPAGGVSSSVIDMARWMRMVLALGSFNGKTVVDRGALMELLTPQIRAGSPPDPANRTSFYGYGIGIGDDGSGRVRLSHSGAFALGAATSFTLLPAERLGIVVLSNGMPIGLPEALIAAFLDLVETGTVQRDWLRDFWTNAFQALFRNPSVLAGLSPPQPPRPARPMAAYGGRYWNAYYGDVFVVPAGDGLMMTVGPAPVRYDLSHWTGDQFRYFPSGENALGAASVRFSAGRDGKIESVEVENFEPGVNVLRRQPAPGRGEGAAAEE
jgi:CubicO group peptidase (beta-lactamase class C family)